MFSLNLYGPLTGNAFIESDNLAEIAKNWSRTSLAIGGFDEGSFTVENLARSTLTEYFDRWLGYRLVEESYGKLSWEGIIWQLDLVLDGINFRRTFDVEWWANKVKAVYSYPTVEDTQQGNLFYRAFPFAHSFQDDGQDFSDWDTNPAAPPAVYRISVINDDDTTANGFLGLAFTITNANDSIYVYTDVSLTVAGWNGTVAGKTPVSYIVSNVLLSGVRQDTGWTTNNDCVEQYGRQEYVISLPGTKPAAATALRDRYLNEYAWPSSRMVGSDIVIGKRKKTRDVLEVTVKGYWHTLNWRHRETSGAGTTSELITSLTGDSEFVTVGRIETNSDDSFVDCDPNIQGLGDLVEMLIDQGDISGNIWQGGVYENRGMIYKQAPSKETHILTDGMLYDLGSSLVIPTLLKPGFYLRNTNAPAGQLPPGSYNFWDDPQVSYIDEVKFSAPDKLSLKLADTKTSVSLMLSQIIGKL